MSIILFYTLSEKVLQELMEPVERRKEIVEEFLEEIKPSLKYDVVTITDPFGPTIHDPDMDLIVLSQETKKGGDMINTEREKKVLYLFQPNVLPLEHL